MSERVAASLFRHALALQVLAAIVAFSHPTVAQPIVSVQAESEAAAAAAPTRVPTLELGHVLARTRAMHPVLAAQIQKIAGSQGKLLSKEGEFDTKLASAGKWVPQGKYDYGIASVGVEQLTPAWGLRGTAGWRLGSGDVPLYFGDDDTATGGEFYLGLALPLLQDRATDRARTDVRQAELGVDATVTDLALLELQLDLEAARAYWDWVAAGSGLLIDEKLLEMAQLRDGQLEGRVKSGDLPVIDRIENQRAILSRQGRVVKARQQLEEAAVVLSLYLRDERGEPMRPEVSQLPPDIAEPGPPDQTFSPDDVNTAFSKRPDLNRVAADLAIAESELMWAENQALPRLDASVEVSQGVAPIPEMSSSLTEVQLGVKLSIPLQLRKATGQAATARAEAGQLEQKARFLRDKIQADIDKLRIKLDATFETLTVTRRELEVARQVEAAELRRLELGDSTILFVNIREVATADAARKVVDALADYQRALAEYGVVTARGVMAMYPGAAGP
jgi:outer membrane protein TolC